MGRALTDTDFHGASTAQRLRITAIVGQLPAALLKEEKSGLNIQGWDDTEVLKMSRR